MTSVILLKDLVTFVTQSLSDYQYRDSQGELKSIQVKDGYLKVREDGDDEDFPYVLIRLGKGKSEYEEATVEVHFFVGVLDKDVDNGYISCLNIIDRIRHDLQATPFVADMYEVRPPFNWEMAEKETYPLWFGMLSCIFTIGNITNAETLVNDL